MSEIEHAFAVNMKARRQQLGTSQAKLGECGGADETDDPLKGQDPCGQVLVDLEHFAGRETEQGREVPTFYSSTEEMKLSLCFSWGPEKGCCY